MSRKGTQKKFALIFWVESKMKDVIPLNKIPSKHRDDIGSIFSLKWVDSVNKSSETFQAKLLAVDTGK